MSRGISGIGSVTRLLQMFYNEFEPELASM